MRTLLLVTVVGCGSTSAPDHSYPLPADTGSAGPVAASAETSEECVPPGIYRVDWDFSTAKVTGAGGLDDDYCRPMVEGLAKQGLDQMTIKHAGSLAIAWPGAQTVVERGACAFDITSRSPAVATITFSGGTGNGTAAFSIETKNHPGERCDVDGAVLLLAKRP